MLTVSSLFNRRARAGKALFAAMIPIACTQNGAPRTWTRAPGVPPARSSPYACQRRKQIGPPILQGGGRAPDFGRARRWQRHHDFRYLGWRGQWPAKSLWRKGQADGNGKQESEEARFHGKFGIDH